MIRLLPALLVVMSVTGSVPAVAQQDVQPEVQPEAQPAVQQKRPFTVVETGKTFWRLDDAVWSVDGRDATIRIAPGVYPECVIQESGRIAFVAEKPGTAIFDGGQCDGKATLVLQGRAAVVDGLVFRNMRNDDGNGSGIRLEAGTLEVRNASFLDSQEGILAGAVQGATILVDHSTFSGVGYCGDDCAHSIYVGQIRSLTVTNSRFERGTGGHYVKSRSARNMITDNSFDDSKGKATNYAIDLPAGSIGTIARNVFVVGPNKENHTAIIAVAAESRENPSQGLVVTDNTASLAPGIPWTTSFVGDWSHEPLAIGTNKVGPGIKPFTPR